MPELESIILLLIFAGDRIRQPNKDNNNKVMIRQAASTNCLVIVVTPTVGSSDSVSTI